MENASQALLIAGGVLIALLVIGLLVWMFTNLSGFQQQEGVQVTSSQIAKFNNEYGSYDKPDLRGSDLYTLLNKVADYNRRQSSAATNTTDTGSDVMYTPMKVTFNLDGKAKDFTPDGTVRLLTSNEITQDDSNLTTNSFADYVSNTVSNLESKYTKDSLTKLVDNMTSIFIDDDRTAFQNAAVERFKQLCPKINGSSTDSYTFNDLKNANRSGQVRYDVYQYSEYVEFKRAHFKCTYVGYDENTGRIIEMHYQFTGDFE